MNVPATAKAPVPLKGGWPLLGHTVPFVRDTLGLLERTHDECGMVGTFRLVNKDIALFSGPAAHEAVFRAPDEQLSPNAAYKMMVPVFGKGVVYDCEPARMGEQLGMLRPALQGRRMKFYGDIVAAETRQALEPWGDDGVADLYGFAQQLTNYTSSHCLLGTEFRNEMSAEFAQVYHDLERGIVPVGYIHPYLPIPAFKRRDRARARLGEMVGEIVARRRASGFRGEDFLQTLMESAYADGSRLTDHEIAGMLIAAMFAGHHTSGSTTAWTILELLRDGRFLAEVVEEIDRVFPPGEEVSLDLKTMRELEKTEWAVKEALRLHPPLFILLREAQEDLELAGYRIRKGTWVAVSPWVAHRDSEVFRDATTYDPRRFDETRAEDAQPFAYIAFGGGRHKCLGNAFALLQIKTIVAILLRQYRFELYGDELADDFGSLVIGPKMPCRVRYTRREHGA
ncbi:MAG: cytochrome P450 [Alphaproteobacteria bacterium]|nr:cytochrome P450 [Alphaproteobacteria bacterium]